MLFCTTFFRILANFLALKPLSYIFYMVLVRKRRAIGEVVAAALLLVVVATATTLALSGSSEQTFEGQQTVSQAIDNSRMQIQEMLSVISTDASAGTIKLEVLNYGKEEIKIDKMMIDAVETGSFTISKYDGTSFTSIPIKEIVTIETTGTGSTLQLVTTSGNLFEFIL